MELDKLLKELKDLENSTKLEFICLGFTVSSEYWERLLKLPEAKPSEMEKIFPGGRLFTGFKGIEVLELPSQLKNYVSYYSRAAWNRAKKKVYKEQRVRREHEQ